MPWLPFFEKVFDDVAPRLRVVLGANGCREGWLQGELYRLSEDDDLAVNWFRYRAGGVADVYGLRPSPRDGAAPMIAEIKIIGGSYLNTCIDGRSDIASYVPVNNGGRVVPTLSQIKAAENCSLLSDVGRLTGVEDGVVGGVRYPVEHRYMVLVRPYGGDDTDLGHALRALKISDEEAIWTYSGFDVRVWHI